MNLAADFPARAIFAKLPAADRLQNDPALVNRLVATGFSTTERHNIPITSSLATPRDAEMHSQVRYEEGAERSGGQGFCHNMVGLRSIGRLSSQE
ncbi:hypothetical protein Psta_4604 [Pirellula staleyi DSM 6068]|uniref:Uncharacterized protein n=1 Tax=Pirellula staleyi (strain ATCC 27377 / DSM 6068 / ICPB 4128) TaxID=530564 RepID=D2R743_PIRSD|nr:hypothetical protein [Pirellula staleyi]ADB19246.1 hypothetical protein Psta_4604 [Pirellula staleyi DSM 6068]